MNKQKQFLWQLKQTLFLFIPIIATFSLAPTQAATIASSQASFKMKNFSSRPLNVNTSAFTVTFTQAEEGEIIAEADAEVFFSMIDPFAISETRSFASGQGNNFFGLADSKTEILGNFLVNRNNNFSFDFDGFLNLATATKSSASRAATAAASISWLLINNTPNTEPSIVGFFDVFAQLDTVGDNDIFISPQNSDNVALNFLNSATNISPTNNTEFINTEFAGLLNTSFTNPTFLTLLEIQNTFVAVEKTPESNSILSILVFTIASCFFRQKKQL